MDRITFFIKLTQNQFKDTGWWLFYYSSQDSRVKRGLSASLKDETQRCNFSALVFLQIHFNIYFR